MQTSLLIEKDATFSPCRKYRYTLYRSWDSNLGYAMFIGLNPSTADETLDDPTVRRCINFARAWGYGGLCMMNLFAYRTKDPKHMKAAHKPIGVDNDKWLISESMRAGVIIAAWGNHGSYLGRDEEVRVMLHDLHYLALTKSGKPKHPLYLKKDLMPKKLKDLYSRVTQSRPQSPIP